MAGDWTDWADGGDLAGMSRSGNVLGSMGYDRDEVVGDPAKQAEVMDKVRSPYSSAQPAARDEAAAQTQATQMAQNSPAAQGPDQRFQAPSGEPPNPQLKTRPAPQATAPAASTQPPPDTLGTPGPTAPQSAPAPNGEQSLAPGAPNPAAPAPATGAAPPAVPWQGYQQQAVQGELGIADTNRKAYESMPAAPDTSTLDSTIETESIPTDPRAVDPTTGKRLYKEGFWGEVGRGLHNFAEGAAGQMDKVTPYSAPNSDYNYEEQQRQGKLTQDQQRKADVLARFKTATDAIKQRAEGLQTVEPDYQHAATGATDAQKAETETQKAATEQQKTDQTSPAGKAALSQSDFDQRTKEADRVFGPGGGGQMRALYLLNGKVPDPRQATAEEIARAQALKTFRQQNGHDPQTMDEVNQVNAAAGGRLKDEGGGGDTPPPQVAADAQAGLDKITSYTAGYIRQPNGNYRSTDGKFTTISGNDFDAKVNELRSTANKGLAKKGWQIDGQGQLVKIGQQSAGAPAPAVRAAPALRPGDPQPPAGATHVYRDKAGKVQGWAVNGQYVALAPTGTR